MVTMNLGLFLVGLAKVAFGLVVGVLGIFAASRILGRLLRAGAVDAAVREGNVALGLLNASATVALGILAQRAVAATFDAMDLVYRDRRVDAAVIGKFFGYAFFHVGLALVIGSVALALGAWVFGKMTRDVDELAEIRRNNIAAALVMSGVLIVLALMTAPGLSTALDGILPLPALAPGEGFSPS
jgi:uncharacterized membrane protein YjfL (UPF0719 family)